MVDEEKINAISFIDVLNDLEGKALVEQIEELENHWNPDLLKVRQDLIKELKDRFGYEYR